MYEHTWPPVLFFVLQYSTKAALDPLDAKATQAGVTSHSLFRYAAQCVRAELLTMNST